jgi:glycosyltransferase involved in cell wall biosynthesis
MPDDGAASAAETYPKVSVVITTRDRPVLLARAISRIFDQDYPGPVECVVVYDQSEAGPLDIDVPTGRELVVRTNIRTPGLPGGRNTGVDASSGEFLAFCDDDDEWRPAKLRLQIDRLRADPSCGAVACGIALVGPDIDKDRPGRAEPVTLDDLLDDRIMEVHPSTMVVRRATFFEAGYVDEEIPGGYAEDYEWLLRVAALGPIQIVAEPLVVVEWHGSSFFFGKWMMIANALDYLLVKHPEFARSRIGSARIHGQIALALASAGQRRQATARLAKVMRLNPREKRLFVTMPIIAGVVSGDRVLRMAQKRGRGV